MNKMDLSGKVQSLVNSDAMKEITAKASSLGLVNQSTIDEMEEKAV